MNHIDPTQPYEELLEATARFWGVVQQENADHRSLVTEEQWDQWREFDRKQSKLLAALVKGPATPANERRLEEFVRQINGSRRASAQELREKRDERERKKREEEEEAKRAKREAERAKREAEAHAKRRRGLLSLFKH